MHMPPNPSSIKSTPEVSTTTEKEKLLSLRKRILNEGINYDHPEREAIDSEIKRLETILDKADTKNNMEKSAANDGRYAVVPVGVHNWDSPTGDGDPGKRGASASN